MTSRKTRPAAGVALLGTVGLVAVLARQPQLVLPGCGTALAVLLVGLRRSLGRSGTEPGAGDQDSAGDPDMLEHWRSGAETRIRWAESTRADWDRHWRPVLARRFAATTGQRPGKDPAAFAATGQLLFGAQLWSWVDPGNVSRTGRGEPGPGRAALEQILTRLEQR